MSGVGEASLVLGIISAIISIIDATYQVYEAVEDEAGLPTNFKKSATKFPLILKLLDDAERYANSIADESTKAAFTPTLENCKVQAVHLQELFRKVMPEEGDSRWDRYVKAARTIGKGGRVESLVGGILDALQLLATRFPEVTTSRGKEQLAKAIEEVTGMEPSLPDDFEKMPAYAHYGSGAQNNNTGGGTQNNNNSTGNQNNGPGQQYIGTNHIDQSVTVHNNATDMMSQCLQDLQVTNPDADMLRIEDTKDTLLKDCYAWILEDHDFRHWQNDGGCPLLWLNGDPGKGKTMLMIALVRELSKFSKSGSAALAFFFCQSTEPALNNAASVLRGLIWKLAHEHGHLARYIQEEYKHAGKKLFEGPNVLHSMWSILSNMLSDSTLSKVYVLVDALDECEAGRYQLLQFIVNNASDPSSKAKWLLSSRNYPEIKALLNLQDHRRILNLELKSSHISQAVNAFIDYKTKELTRQKAYDSTLQTEVKRQLSEKADSTFLWVALVCKRLMLVRRRQTLSVLTEFLPGLQPLYERMMDQLLLLEVDDRELCTRILRSIAIAYRPLILEELVIMAKLPQDLLDDTESLSELIELCGSFITLRKGTVYFVHQSAKDYFASGGQRIFSSSIKDEHARTVDISVGIMSDLKIDICKLEQPGALARAAVINRDLRCIGYACCFWVKHLAECDISKYDFLSDEGSVRKFLSLQLLHWLEALSLIGKTSEGVLAIISLEALIPADKSPNLYAFVHDAKRFALYNRLVIEQAPLQLYCSALVFAPENSIVRKKFEYCIPPWIQRKPRVQANWGNILSTLEGHTAWVSSVAFSPDGKRVVSGSDDETVRLWDAVAGTALQTLKGHTGWVSSVAFSPDSKRVVSGSGDKTVRLWDAVAGTALQTLEGHTGGVSSVAFSPDSKRVVSGSSDKTVRLWDAVAGTALQTLEGHTGVVSSVAFSPDGKRLPNLFVSNDWLVEGVTKILWLPPDYRSPSCVAVWNGNLVLGYYSGKCYVLGFQGGSKVL